MLCCLDMTGGSLVKTSTSSLKKSAMVDLCHCQLNMPFQTLFYAHPMLLSILQGMDDISSHLDH